MRNEIVNRTFAMPKGQELQDLISFCKVMADSPFYRKLGTGGIMSIVLTAKELNLPLMPCLNGGMHNVDGCVTLSAQLMKALILMNGHKADIIELTEELCTIQFKRSDEENVTQYTYTVEDARKANYLNKNNWKSHLKDMLYCRCISGGARKIMADVILGCYVHGEIKTKDDTPYDELQLTEKNEPRQVEFQKVDGYEDFVKEYNLDKEDSAESVYVMEISKTSKKPEKVVISLASQNRDKFKVGFEKWQANQNVSVSPALEAESVDEV